MRPANRNRGERLDLGGGKKKWTKKRISDRAKVRMSDEFETRSDPIRYQQLQARNGDKGLESVLNDPEYGSLAPEKESVIRSKTARESLSVHLISS